MLYQLSYVGGAPTVATFLGPFSGLWHLPQVELAQSRRLVGRDEELDRVRAFFDAPDRAARKLLLEGEAGIGKTTLWRAGLDEAVRSGQLLLEARPAAAERELSFAALGDLLATAGKEIASLPAPQRRALRIALVQDDPRGEPPEQRTIAVAVTELLRRMSRDAPVVIALDDMHWLDLPSAAILEFALRRLNDVPVLVFATSRNGQHQPLTFADDERLAVGPLSLDALDALTRERLDTRFLRPVLRQLEDASGGNPFYALELANELLRSGRHVEPGERLRIPTRLRAVAGRRLTSLTPEARRAVLATAALGQPVAPVVEAAADGGGTAIAEAVSAGILETEGEIVRFTHPLFASSVYDDAAPADRKAIHRRLAQLVTDPEERARQLAEGADGPDATVALFVEGAAASVAARGAPDVALRLAKLAVELTPADRRNALHKRRLDCARYSVAAGDPRHAAALLERQLEVAATGREHAEVELELGRASFATRGVSAATTHYERALREVDGSDELELQALILTELAHMHLLDMPTRSDASERAVALAEKVWNPELLARALACHGLTQLDHGQPPLEEYWNRALEIERAGGELREGGPAHAYAIALFVRGELETAATRLREVADSMRRRGDSTLPSILLYLSDIARAAGHWQDGAEYADEAYDVAVQSGLDSLEPLCLLCKARFTMLRGELAPAGQQVEEALARLERLGPRENRPAAADRSVPEGLASSLLGRIALMSERYAEAHEWFAPDIASLREMDSRELLVEAIADDVNALVALGRLDEAAGAADEMSELVGALEDPWLEALAARAGGVVAAANGELKSAAEMLQRSHALLESRSSAWPFEVARTLLALGAVQRRARQKQSARASLEHALEIFERLGARLWADKTRRELAQISGRAMQTAALTETERRVAEIVAAGRSNAEAAHELFMSPKTVEWNLSKVYRKLHVRSRAELAAKLARQPSQLQS